MKVELLDWNAVDTAALDALPDRIFCQRRHWLEFVSRVTRGTPIVGALVDDAKCIGYVCGMVVKICGLRIFGSPFVGWTTPYMGFNLKPGVSRREAFRAIGPFVFRELGCAYLEIRDRFTTPEDVAGLGFEAVPLDTYVSDLTRSENELFFSMPARTRHCIKKAQRCSVTIEEAEPEGFSAEYYVQLQGVFARQGLRPTYDETRLQTLIDCVFDSGDLLLLRARGPDGTSIATAVYCGFNDISYFWGNASLRQYLTLRPNQALNWHALRYWKHRGAKLHDWGGGGSYKEAYGPSPIVTWSFRKARSRIFGWGRNIAQASYYTVRDWRKELHTGFQRPPPTLAHSAVDKLSSRAERFGGPGTDLM